jgi:hypothetical protein
MHLLQIGTQATIAAIDRCQSHFSSEGDSLRSRRAIFATAFPMFQTASVAKEIKVLGIGNVRFSVNLRSGAERPTWLRGDAPALLHSITNPFRRRSGRDESAPLRNLEGLLCADCVEKLWC